MMLLAGACSPNQPPPSSGESGSPLLGARYPLGMVTRLSTTVPAGVCLAGDDCLPVRVDCPGVQQPDDAALDVIRPSGSPRGLVMFWSGGGGTKLWATEAENAEGTSSPTGGKTVFEPAARKGTALLHTFAQNGFMTVQVRWLRPWLASAPGEEVGPARLACRGATLMKWVHDTLYTPLGVNPKGLACGFCVTGNSGGASMIAYALAFYGLGAIVVGAVMSGGPPHAALAKGCLGPPPFQYSQSLLTNFDASYGFLPPRHGPCWLHDRSWVPRWNRDGVDTGGSTYDYPRTRILLLLGAQDPTGVGPHEMVYYERTKARSPDVQQVTIPSMTHAITASDSGLGLIKREFLGQG